MQKMTFLKRDFFSAGPGNHCFSKKMIQTKVPDKDKIRAVLTVKEFLGFVAGKVIKNGFPLVASWVGHPVGTLISKDEQQKSFWAFYFLN